MASFRIAVSAIIFQEQSVLLALRDTIDWWNLPGGGMEYDETIEEAVCREVREETGLEVKINRLVAIYSKPQKQEIVLSFLCTLIGGTLLQSTEESRECRYFPVDNLPVNLLPKHRQRVEDALLNSPSALLKNQTTSTTEDQSLF